MADDASTKIGIDTTQWKTGITEINRDVKLLESGFKVVAAGMDDWQKSAEGLTARNETLTQKIEHQKKAVELYEGELRRMQEAAEANGDTSDKTAQAIQSFQIKVNQAKEALAKSETELRKNNNSLVEMEAKEGEAEKATEDLSKEVKKSSKLHIDFGEAMKSVAGVAKDALATGLNVALGAITAVGAAVGAAAAQAYDFAKNAGKLADDVATLSAQTGVSTTELQKWAYTSNFIDTPVETMTKSMAKMVKGMGDADGGSKTAQENFKALGLNIYDSSGKLKDSEALFAEAIDALGKISNEAERDAKAMALFGKSAQELNPLILAGGEAFRQMGEEAERMGVVFNDEQIERMGAFDDAMQQFNATGEGLKNTIGLQVMPLFQPLVELTTSSMASISVALKDGLQPGELNEIFSTITTSLRSTIENITGVIKEVLPIVIEALNLLIPEIVAFIPTLAETLIPAAKDLLQAILNAILDNIDMLLNVVTELISAVCTFIIENLPLLIDAGVQIVLKLAQYMAENVGQMVDGIRQIMTAIIDGIIVLLPELIPLAMQLMVAFAVALVEALPKLLAKMPEIVGAIIEGLTKIEWLKVGMDMIQGLVNGLLAGVQALGKAIGDVFHNILKIILGVFGIASPSKEMASVGGFILDGLVNGLWAGINAVLDAVKSIFGKIWDTIKSIFGFGSSSEESKEAKSAGQDIMKGMEQGIKDNEKTLKDVVVNVSKNVLQSFRREFGIPEPSGAAEKTKAYGKSIAEGVRDGMSENAKPGLYSNASNELLNAIGSALRSAFGIAGTGILGLGAASASKFKDIGKAIAEGIAQGLNEGVSSIKKAATTAAQNALAAAKKELGIKSPSRKAYEEIGLPFIQGISNAMLDSKRALDNTLSETMSSLGRDSLQPLSLQASSLSPAMQPIQAELILDGQRFGKIVFELADEGAGQAFGNFNRMKAGVSIA